jgi:hypothetical protein
LLASTVSPLGSASIVAQVAEPPPVPSLVVGLGDTPTFGDPSGLALEGPLVSIASTPTGNGYWLAAGDGGVFAYGDAPWFGSIPQVLPAGVSLREPIVDLIAHGSGRGYWLVASDGGVFAYGEAPWFGSIPQVLPPGTRLRAPITAAAPTPSGKGYWLLGADGGVFTFGDATYHGSVPELDRSHSADAVAIIPTAGAGGYAIHLRDGRVMPFGDASPTGPFRSPVADADAVGSSLLSTTLDGANEGITTSPTDAQSGIASVAVRHGGGAWVLRNAVGPVIAIWQSGGLSSTSREAALTLADGTGAKTTVRHSGSIDYVSSRRLGQVIDAAPSGWRIPLSAVAFDTHSADILLGGPSARSFGRDEIVVGTRTAERHSIRRGDVLELYGWNNETVFVTVGHVAAAIELGNIELAMNLTTAAKLGFSRPSAVLTWAFDHQRIESALVNLPSNQRWLTTDRSWVSSGRDSVLSTSVLKDLAGEPAYLPGGPGDPVIFRQQWIDEHIAFVDLPIVGSIRCNTAIHTQLVAAFTDIEAAGLSDLIDIADTRAHGGCFYPRTIRGSSGGSLSRHSWGVAFDLNPNTNRFGTTPTMDQRIVAIFRSQGFAWGGSWIRPDGMHFEWTGPVEEAP